MREDFGIRLEAIDKIPHGADDAAEVWRGRDAQGASYAIKRSAGGSSAGLTLSAYLAQHGVPGVAAPLPTLDARLWTIREGRRLSIAPWLSDVRALDAGMSAQQWTDYGALLARLHATPRTAVLEEMLPHETYTHDRVATKLRKVDERLAEANDDDPLVSELEEAWRADSGAIWSLLEQADALGEHLRTQPFSTVVCHADPHLGNVLLGKDHSLWLIDWDDSILSTRERDLMFFCAGGVIVAKPVTAEQRAWFHAGYGDVELEPTRLLYYQSTRALEDLVHPAAQILEAKRDDDAERERALGSVRDMMSPTSLLRVALASLQL